MNNEYFKTELGTLYHGDCLQIMQQIPDNSIDLILTDPPYGINWDSRVYELNNKKMGVMKAPKGNYKNTTWDNSTPDKQYFDHLFRISKNQIVFGGNYFTEYLPSNKGWLVWDKNINGKFGDAELIFTSFDKPIRIINFTWNGMIQHDMKNKETRYHPTQKPTKLIELLLQKYSKKNDTVLDCFLGSGTTAIACENLDRHWIGIEQNKDYCDISVNRLKQATQQLKLFSFGDL